MIARYGLDRRPVGTIITVAVVILASVAALAFVGVGLGRDTLQAQLLTWSVIAPDHSTATFEIQRQTPEAVTCVLRAQDESHADVGYAPIVIESGELRVRVTYELRTLAPAYVVEIAGCSMVGSAVSTPPQFPPGVVPPTQPWLP